MQKERHYTGGLEGATDSQLDPIVTLPTPRVRTGRLGTKYVAVWARTNSIPGPGLGSGEPSIKLVVCAPLVKEGVGLY